MLGFIHKWVLQVIFHSKMVTEVLIKTHVTDFPALNPAILDFGAVSGQIC